MILLLISSVFCKVVPKIKLYEFNKTQYKLYRDSLDQNHFLISLVMNNKSESFNFYHDLFNEICYNISYYIKEEINITYAILIDNTISIKHDAVLIIYLPGMSEVELDINTHMSAAFNSNKILNKCLALAIHLRRFEKAQKSPEVARIKKELRGISKMLKMLSSDDPKRKELLNDYSSLTNELMQYISGNKQKSKKLKLKLQIQPDDSSKAKKIEKKIKKIKKKEKKHLSKKLKSGLSPKQLQRITEKKMINALKVASKDSYSYLLKNPGDSAYNSSVIHGLNSKSIKQANL